jgi:hypothetical protein
MKRDKSALQERGVHAASTTQTQLYGNLFCHRLKLHSAALEFDPQNQTRTTCSISERFSYTNSQLSSNKTMSPQHFRLTHHQQRRLYL